ncbi:replicative DNA helicase [Desulfurella sp.]|uniref:replicative DNA helicase n=1 Tax=Desulfurella sp. TaxID=1962857 RepID=UPI0025BFBFDE|nr:replicative DNA helicase [Desulfurella sp.]
MKIDTPLKPAKGLTFTSIELPNAYEAEKALLSALFLDNSKIGQALEYITDKHFYDKRNALIFQTMLVLYSQGISFDHIIVANHLGKQLDTIGGMDYLIEITDYLPNISNITHYAKIIYQKSVLRELIFASQEIADVAYSDALDTEEILNFAEKKIFNISTKKTESYKSLNDIGDEIKELIQNLKQRNTEVTGLPTGFIDIDRMLNGFQRGDLIILAARPSMGKTAFAVNIAINMAQRTNLSIGIFSLEMTYRQIALRILSSMSNIEFYKIKSGNLSTSEWNLIVKTIDKARKLRIYIDDSSLITSLDIRTKARKLKIERNIDFLIIDYLQLIEGLKRENRVQEVSEISRSLKILAKELNIPILALSQLNRSVEQRDNKRPMMSDLRESGSIEQDADIVMFIYRDDVYNKKNSGNEQQTLAEIHIAKHRNGPTGTVELLFHKNTTTFKNMSDEQSVDKFYNNVSELEEF